MPKSTEKGYYITVNKDLGRVRVGYDIPQETADAIKKIAKMERKPLRFVVVNADIHQPQGLQSLKDSLHLPAKSREHIQRIVRAILVWSLNPYGRMSGFFLRECSYTVGVLAHNGN